MRENVARLSGREWLKLYLLAALMTVVLLAVPVSSQIPSGSQGPGGNGPTGMSLTNGLIPATSTLVTLTAPSCYVTITNLSTTTTIYWNTVNPATTNNFPIAPSTSYSYLGSPLTQFWIIGSAASGGYGVSAH